MMTTTAATTAAAAAQPREFASFPLLSPGVSQTAHCLLRVVLALLVALLATDVVLGWNTPHSTVMLVLALALLGSYVWVQRMLTTAEAAEAEAERDEGGGGGGGGVRRKRASAR